MYQTEMKAVSKNKIRTITLWIGVVLALLLIMGSLAMNDNNFYHSLFSWVYESSPLSAAPDISPEVIKTWITKLL